MFKATLALLIDMAEPLILDGEDVTEFVSYVGEGRFLITVGHEAFEFNNQDLDVYPEGEAYADDIKGRQHEFCFLRPQPGTRPITQDDL